MPGNVFAGDILGAYLLAQGDFAGTLDDSGVMGAGTDAAGTYQLTGTQAVHQALSNAALSTITELFSRSKFAASRNLSCEGGSMRGV